MEKKYKMFYNSYMVCLCSVLGKCGCSFKACACDLLGSTSQFPLKNIPSSEQRFELRLLQTKFFSPKLLSLKFCVVDNFVGIFLRPCARPIKLGEKDSITSV